MTYTAEVKRMFVIPAERGKGISRRILALLEQMASRYGYTTIKLETGNRQPEAIGLYERAGYVRIPCYSIYQQQPWSRCFAKELVPNQSE